jgi:hypothetical protein
MRSREENMPLMDEVVFNVGDTVTKQGGDYRFAGVVVAAFRKLSHAGEPGAHRYVVENRDGVLHIFSGKQLALAPAASEDETCR